MSDSCIVWTRRVCFRQTLTHRELQQLLACARNPVCMLTAYLGVEFFSSHLRVSQNRRESPENPRDLQ